MSPEIGTSRIPVGPVPLRALPPPAAGESAIDLRNYFSADLVDVLIALEDRKRVWKVQTGVARANNSAVEAPSSDCAVKRI
jgi:hypothetical protein